MKRVPLTIVFLLLLCFCAKAQTEPAGGSANDGVYTNPFFNFTFKYPKDWVVHGEATNERIRELGEERIAQSGTSKESVAVALKNTYQLLTVFRHAVGTPGITFNPAILVMAEKVSHAPGIKNGSDYLLNVRALLTKAGHQVLLKDPKEYQFGGSQFFRDNYGVVANGVHLVQTHFVTIRSGYALVFIFMAEDEKSVDEMTKAMETFDAIPPVRRGVTTVIGSAPERKPN
ncbi:MAG: hypothetical protein V7638_4313 [Acidobacteriota bacterium]|jgi:hypothetical protein